MYLNKGIDVEFPALNPHPLTPLPVGEGKRSQCERGKEFFLPSPTGRRVGDEGLARKKEPNPPLSTGGLLIRWDQVLCYLVQNILRVIEYLIVTESQHAETLAEHVRIANL